MDSLHRTPCIVTNLYSVLTLFGQYAKSLTRLQFHNANLFQLVSFVPSLCTSQLMKKVTPHEKKIHFTHFTHASCLKSIHADECIPEKKNGMMARISALCFNRNRCTVHLWQSWLSSDTHGDPAQFKEGEEREDKSILIQDKQHTEGGLHQPSRSGQNTSIPRRNMANTSSQLTASTLHRWLEFWWNPH